MGSNCSKILEYISYPAHLLWSYFQLLGQIRKSIYSEEGNDESRAENILANDNVNDNQLYNIIYTNCNPETEIENVKIEDIVKYLFNKINFKFGFETSEESYTKCCECLGKCLRNGEPYTVTAEMENSNKKFTINQIINNIPSNMTNREFIVMAVRNILNAKSSQASQISSTNYFTGLKVSQAGDNLQINPCLLSLKETVLIRPSFLPCFVKTTRRQFIEFKHMIYILNTFQISNICAKITEDRTENRLTQAEAETRLINGEHETNTTNAESEPRLTNAEHEPCLINSDHEPSLIRAEPHPMITNAENDHRLSSIVESTD